MNQSYLPAQSLALLIWLNNYKVKIQEHGSTLGYSPEKIAELVTHCDAMSTAIQLVETKKKESKSAVDNRKTKDKIDLAAIKSEVSRQKVNENYTLAIGQELGIIGSVSGLDVINYKASISTDITGGHVEIKFKKWGLMVLICTIVKKECQTGFSSKSYQKPFYRRDYFVHTQSTRTLGIQSFWRKRRRGNW